jgi:broad specificity phosphatase PhoE
VNRLLFAALAFVFCSGAACAQPTIFIVRHAEKAQGGDAKDPDLSDAGRERAESLTKVLKDANVTSIFVTEFKRTQQTAEPLAHAAKISVTIVPAKETESLIAKLKSAQGNALVVAHSNTIPEILKSLGAPLSATIEDSDYDNLFVVTAGAPPQLIRLHLPSRN